MNDEIRLTEPVTGLTTRAHFQPSTVDEEARTVDLVWSTGARVLRRGFFTDDFYEELGMGAAAIRMDRLNQGAPLLDSHNGRGLNNVLGVVERAWLKDGYGHATVRFSERAEVVPIFAAVKAGILRNISVGYKVYKYERVEEEGKIDVLRATDWEPHELSLVPIPADKDSQVRSLESATSATDESEVSEMTRKKTDKPAAKPEVTDDELDQRTDPEPEPTPEPEPEPTRSAEPPQGTLDERTRGILKSCRQAGLGVDRAQELIESDLSLAEARHRILEEFAKSEATVHSHVDIIRDEQVTMRSAVAEALLHRHDPSRNELTDLGRQYRGMSMMEMARDMLERRGVSTRGMSRSELAGRALHATSDFPFITADVANKVLRRAYESTIRTFTAWARQSSAPDFKTLKRIQLGEAPSLERVNEGGEFKHGTIGEAQESYQLLTYGKIVNFSRQLLINDDLSAFTRVPELFGRAAADLESDTVYNLLVANPTMNDSNPLFDAAHGNVMTAGAISVTTLAEGRKLMREQTGLSGRFINVMPRYLLVGPTQETAAAQYMATDMLADQASNVNVFKGAFQIIVEPRITTDDWYLISDPAAIDTFEYAYLEGESGVSIDTEMGFDVDGLRIKARHDFGTGPIDWRGMTFNAGS